MAKINFIKILLTKFCIYFIKFYQIFLSKLLFFPRCRFYPSCSNYAIEAIEKRGIIKGIYLAILRILRCNPFNDNCGFDPVENETIDKAKNSTKQKPCTKKNKK